MEEGEALLAISSLILTRSRMTWFSLRLSRASYPYSSLLTIQSCFLSYYDINLISAYVWLWIFANDPVIFRFDTRTFGKITYPFFIFSSPLHWKYHTYALKLKLAWEKIFLKLILIYVQLLSNIWANLFKKFLILCFI